MALHKINKLANGVKHTFQNDVTYRNTVAYNLFKHWHRNSVSFLSCANNELYETRFVL